MACIHGIAPGECLICRTLASGSDAPGQPRRTRTSRRRRRDGTGRAGGGVDVLRRGPAVGVRFGPVSHLVVGVAAVVALLVALFFVAGVIFAILRLVELLAVAAVVGLVAYRVGRARGRRDR